MFIDKAFYLISIQILALKNVKEDLVLLDDKK